MTERDPFPLVSVVIPTRDRHDEVARAVSSAIKQTYRLLEVLVVDDGSRQPVELDLDEPRVRIVRSPTSRGRSAARNLGVRKAMGSLIAFLDDDDEWQREHVRLLVEAYQMNPDVALVESGHEGWKHGTMVYRQIPRTDRPRTAVFKEARIATSTVMVVRDAFEAVEGFDESLDRNEDWDLWTRLATRWPFAVVPAPTVRRDVQSTVTARERLTLHRSMVRRISPLLRILSPRERFEVRLWLARTGALRALQVPVEAVGGERAWRRLASLRTLRSKGELDQPW